MIRVGLKRVAAIAAVSLAFAAAVGTVPASANVEPGKLVVGTTIVTNTLDPHKAPYPAVSFLTNLLYDRLTDIDKNGKVVPMLATSWNIKLSKVGSTATFNLRKNVKFADGTPFNADAVVASIQRAQNLPGSTAAQYFVGVQVKKVSDSIVSFYRNIQYGGVTNIPGTLAGGVGAIISPKAIAANQDLSRSAAGIGMFQLTSFNIAKLTGDATAGYWDKAAQKLQKIEINWLAQPAARVNAVQTNAVQLANIPPQVERAVNGTGNFTVLKGRNANSVIDVNLSNRGVLTDVRVRQALSMSLDRSAICSAVLGGACDAAFQPFSVWSRDFNKSDKNVETQYSLAKAKAMVEAAGATGKSFNLGSPANTPAYEAIATILQAQAKQIGIDINIITVPSTQLVADFENGKFDAIVGNLGPYTDPADIISRYYVDASKKTNPIVDRKMVALYNQSNKTSSAAARTKLYQQMSALQQKTMTTIPVVNENFWWAKENAVKGFVAPSALGFFSVRGVSVG